MKDNRYEAEEEEEGGGAAWLTTFNDLMTLLMVFFVLLFTMSSIDVSRVKNFSNSLQAGLGVLMEGNQVSVTVLDSQKKIVEYENPKNLNPGFEDMQVTRDVDTPGKQRADRLSEKIFREMSFETAAHPLHEEEGVEVTVTRTGGIIGMEDNLLFDLGDAAINPEGLPVLDKIIRVLGNLPRYNIRIQGHTDNIPINTARYPSNWELSIARAVNVLKYVEEKGRIDPGRLSAVGYGDSMPLVPNDSHGNRARNRRVEIVLEMKENLEHVE